MVLHAIDIHIGKLFPLQKYILSHWLQKVQQVWDKIACFIHIVPVLNPYRR